MMETVTFNLVEAACGDKRPKVKGRAYSGGKMNLPGWRHPVVVDLSGMEIPDTVPLLANHENRTDCRVGMVHASVVDNALDIDGEIFSDGEAADDIVKQAKAGADWQMSIGADVKASELVMKGTRNINGMDVEAPFYHVTQCALREVSVVAVGADSSTSMQIAAKFELKGGNDMTDEEVKNIRAEAEDDALVPAGAAEVKADASGDITAIAREAGDAAVKAERSRVAEIQTICGGEFGEIERKAISAGWTADETRGKVLEAMRSARPKPSASAAVSCADTGKTLEAAFAMRAGIDEKSLLASYGEQTVEAAWSRRGMSICDLMASCLEMNGQHVQAGCSTDNATIRAAFSTVSLPNILSNVANKKLLQSFQAQPIIATKLCSTGDLNDFKESDRVRLTDAGDLQPVAADGAVKHGELIEETATNQLDTYAKSFVLTRKMIINDDLGAFLKIPVAMGNRAARLIDQLFFKRLLANPTQKDGNALFSSAHKNLLTGTASALSKTALEKAEQLFLEQVDADGQPISILPKWLLVCPAGKSLGAELIHGTTLIMSGSDNVVRPAYNALADDNLQLVVSPYLSNTGYTGNSSTAWYLFGDPAQTDTFEIGYLKGKRTPTVEQGETDFNALGMWFRVYFDVGVREQSHRGMVKANGAN